MSALHGSAEGTATTGLDSSPVDSSPETLASLPPLTEQTRLECRELMARYPVARSALLPMLHLVQSVQGYVSPEGVELCAQELGITKAEVGAVATFYTMYKRSPTGRHIVSVCTNTLCNVLGGQRIFEAVKADLGVGHNQTAADGSITLEHAECLAACDYAPVVTVDYEFYDQQDVESTRELVAALRRGEKPPPTRGAPLTDFRGVSRQLAGFSQFPDAESARAAVDGPSAGVPTLIGVRLAAELGESAPPMPSGDSTPAPDVEAPRAATRPSGDTSKPKEKEAADARVAAADNPAERAGAKTADPDRKGPSRRETGLGTTGTSTPPTRGASGQGQAPDASPDPTARQSSDSSPGPNPPAKREV